VMALVTPEGLGDRELQGGPAQPDAARPAASMIGVDAFPGLHRVGHVDRAAWSGSRVLGLPGRERDRQLCEDRAAGAGENSSSIAAGPGASAASGAFGRSGGASEVTAPARRLPSPRQPLPDRRVVTMALVSWRSSTPPSSMSACRHMPPACRSSYDGRHWTLTSYLVANGIVVRSPAGCRAVAGTQQYFCCASPCSPHALPVRHRYNLSELVVFRLLQGFFGGGLAAEPAIPSSSTRFEPSQRGARFSVVAVGIIFAPILGPTWAAG